MNSIQETGKFQIASSAPGSASAAMWKRWLISIHLVSLLLAGRASSIDRDSERKVKKKVKYAYLPAGYDDDGCQMDAKPTKGPFSVFAFMTFTVVTVNVVADIVHSINIINNNNVANSNNSNNNNMVGRRKRHRRCRATRFYSNFSQLWRLANSRTDRISNFTLNFSR